MVSLSNAANQSASDQKTSAPVIIGTYFSVLDDKGRLIIPAKLRVALTERFYLIREADDNIGLYSFATGQDLFEHCELSQREHPEDEEIAAAVERIVSSAVEVAAEGDWRIALPDVLRYYAQLDKSVVTVGALNHAVLWDRERWQAEQEKNQDNAGVRRVQAAMMRAAAAGIRKQVKASPEIERTLELGESAVATTGAGRQGVGGGVRGLESEPAAAVASAGNGGRGSRTLTLSQLGR